jgi:hypothetical protein
MNCFYRLTAVFFLLVMGEKIFAQQIQLPTATKKVLRCYTTEVINEYRKKHPNAETDAQFETWLSKKKQERKAQRGLVTNYTIPIIFHVISQSSTIGSGDNLTASMISEQLLQLNKDFANLSNSQYSVASNTGIQFVLAENDTVGKTLTEPGIQRINSTVKGWTDYTGAAWRTGYIDSIVKPGSIWSANKYFNVWIIPNITNLTANSVLLGYSTFPATSTLTGLNNSETNTTAGVVVITGSVGSVFLPYGCGTSYGLGKTLTHETGHFFGLRHIWGDANCGDDFCDDTPIHTTSNSGVPSHPKSNSCGTPDEMFENYMDYTDDIVLNTFTSNQGDRMQTVMLNSPRRLSLVGSSAGSVPNTASNKLSFINCTGLLRVPETGVNKTYPRYRDVDLTLNVENKATGPAIVTVTTSGTAINNFHYQLMTPTLTFAAGDNFKDVKIRIFDNAEIDGDKTIIVGFNISSGTGVSAGSAAQSVTVKITDDDYQHYGSNTIPLLNEDFGTSGGNLPSGWQTGIFIASQNTFTVGNKGGAGITGQSLYITNNQSTKPLNYLNSAASDALGITPKISTAGYTNPILSFIYLCNGETNASVPVDYGQLVYSYDLTTFNYLTDVAGNKSNYQGVTAASNSGNIVLPMALQDTSFYITFRWINDNNNIGTNPPFLIDDVKVTVTPYPIETTVSNSYSYDVRSGSGLSNFKSTNNKAIVFIKNASTNLTDITAQITQAGSGTTTLTTTGGAYLRTQKVFQVSPAVANRTSTYQATFYFTEAELATWGANKLTLKILKVKDGVSLAGTIDASNAALITPTVFEDAASGYITYTGNFTGFSQFVLVSPATTLPVTLTNFAAKPTQKNIQLSWSTELEINNRGFIVDRSLDGSNFKQIGWINGNVTTSLNLNYGYTDRFVQPGIVYYYRIRQVDINDRQEYSVVRNARISKSDGIVLTVSPNPAKGFVNLFISGTTNKASVELINATGQKILQKNDVNAFDGIYQLSLKGSVKGTYNVVVHLPEGTYSTKIIVE